MTNTINDKAEDFKCEVWAFLDSHPNIPERKKIEVKEAVNLTLDLLEECND